jgi:hypothetical protein
MALRVKINIVHMHEVLAGSPRADIACIRRQTTGWAILMQVARIGRCHFLGLLIMHLMNRQMFAAIKAEPTPDRPPACW